MLVLRPADWAGLHQKQIAEVEKAGLDFRKIEVTTVPDGVGSLVVEKRAIAALEFRHDIRVRGRRIGSGGEDRVWPSLPEDCRVNRRFPSRRLRGCWQAALAEGRHRSF